MRRIVGTLAVVALALVACGGDGGEEAVDEPPPPSTESCEDLSGGATFTIDVADNSFSPACAIASRSQGLTLASSGANQHTFTIDDTVVDVPVSPGATQNLEPINDALAAGTYTVYCRFHGNPDGGGMTMELRVS